MTLTYPPMRSSMMTSRRHATLSHRRRLNRPSVRVDRTSTLANSCPRRRKRVMSSGDVLSGGTAIERILLSMAVHIHHLVLHVNTMKRREALQYLILVLQSWPPWRAARSRLTLRMGSMAARTAVGRVTCTRASTSMILDTLSIEWIHPNHL